MTSAVPTVSINDIEVSEGVPFGYAIFTFTLSEPSSETVVVQFTASDNNSGQVDFSTGSERSVTFAPGQTTAQYVVGIANDTIDEPDQTFTLTLQQPTNALLGDAVGTGTIIDDDAPPTITISADQSFIERDSGFQRWAYTLTVTGQTEYTDGFASVTLGGGTATRGVDYFGFDTVFGATPLSSGSVSDNGQIFGDTALEADETFFATLTAFRYTVIDGSAQYTILNDDGGISISDAVVDENAGTATFTVSLSAPSVNTVSVDYTTANGTADTGDYSARNGTLIFPAGQTSGTITVPIIDDNRDENDQTFFVNLSNPVNATITDGQGIGAIRDNDAALRVTLSDVQVVEGNSGQPYYLYKIGVEGESELATSLTVGLTGGTATNGSDYKSFEVSYFGGVFDKPTFGKDFNILGDTAIEANETIVVPVTDSRNVTIVDGTGIITILNDDANISIGDANIDEDAGTATFTVSLSAALGVDLTLDYAAANGTAGAGDLTPTSGKLTILAGTTSGTITVPITDDDIAEASESFTVNISNATYGTITDAQGLGTIADDDANTAPTGNDGTVAAREDVPYVFKLADFGFADADGDALLNVIVSPPSGGSLLLDGVVVTDGQVIAAADIAAGKLVFVGPAETSGSYAFDFRVQDDGGTDFGGVDTSETYTLTLAVATVNDAPVAADDLITGDGRDPVFISFAELLANDGDVESGVLTVTGVSGATNGTAQLVDGGVLFTPGAGGGDGSFVYTVSDGTGGSDTAVARIDTAVHNDPPVARDDVLSGTQGEVRVIAAGTLLANDSDPDGDPLSLVSVGNATGGSVVLRADGSVAFTPAAGFAGAAGFDYVVRDAEGLTDTARVTLVIARADGGNNAPVIVEAPDLVGTFADTAIRFMVDARDADGDTLTFSASGADNGRVTIGADGTVLYTPDQGFSGSDSVLVTVSDGNGGTATTRIDVTVAERLDEADAGFRLFAGDGLEGEVGGTGLVFGTGASESITVLDEAGQVVFDPTFNGGGDTIVLAGDGSDWSVARSGSAALLSDGDTFVVIPVGRAGMALVFDDGVRELVFAGGEYTLGGQALATSFAPLDADADGTIAPDADDPSAQGQLYLADGSDTVAGGSLMVVGTNGTESLTITYGEILVAASNGGDTFVFDDPASDFEVSLNGSRVMFDGSDTLASIPVAIAAPNTIATSDDSGLLAFGAGTVTIGSQTLTTTPETLTFG